MPSRIIRDGILTSERVNSLSERAELFYRRLMSVVDDHGRYFANPTLLRASCYPLKLDSVKEDSIKKHLAEAEGAGLIVLYTVAATAYLEIQDFGQRVQAKSKFPPRDGGAREMTDDHGDQPPSTVVHRDPPWPTVENGLVVVGVGDEVEGVTRKRARTRKAPIPDDFGVSERVQKWAQTKGFARLREHLEFFVSKARAKGYRYADWDEAFMGAIRDDWAKLREGPPPRHRKMLGEGSSTNYGDGR